MTHEEGEAAHQRHGEEPRKAAEAGRRPHSSIYGRTPEMFRPAERTVSYI